MPRVQKRMNNLQEFLTAKSDKPRDHLKCMIKKPIPSKMFEPKIQTKQPINFKIFYLNTNL